MLCCVNTSSLIHSPVEEYADYQLSNNASLCLLVWSGRVFRKYKARNGIVGLQGVPSVSSWDSIKLASTQVIPVYIPTSNIQKSWLTYVPSVCLSVSYLNTINVWSWIILCGDAVLCAAGCWAPSLASTHQVPAAPLVLTTKNDPRHCQTSPLG